MRIVTIHEAKTHLSRLFAEVESGEEIVIARGRRPIARLCRLDHPDRRVLGRDEGVFQVSDDFDEPPEEILREFFT